MKALYLDKGYSDAAVTASFVPGDTPTTVKAVFVVTEGVPTTIKEIHFSGNTLASESTLRGLMKTKAQFLFDSGVFQESKLEEDKAAIVAYYTDHGYVDAKIDNITRTIQTQQGRNYLVLTIYLTEGDQWKYGGMKITGNTVFSDAPPGGPVVPEAGEDPQPPEGAGRHLEGQDPVLRQRLHLQRVHNRRAA